MRMRQRHMDDGQENNKAKRIRATRCSNKENLAV